MNKQLWFLLLLLTVPALAQPTWFSSKLKRIYPLSTGMFVVTFIDGGPSCSDANNPKYYRVAVGENGITQEGSDKLYSLFLSAALAKKTVTINFESATPSCYINRAFVDYE